MLSSPMMFQVSGVTVRLAAAWTGKAGGDCKTSEIAMSKLAARRARGETNVRGFVIANNPVSTISG